MTEDPRLIMLRVQLFAAVQALDGAQLAAFWDLIDDVQATRALYPPPPKEG